jgi:antitoxin PrlF
MQDAKLLTSRLNLKYQATIPRQVREILGIGRGDSIVFLIADGKVFLENAPPVHTSLVRMLDGTLDDWNSAEDDDAFSNL